MQGPNKRRSEEDKSTVRTVSRSIKGPERQPGKQITTPQRSPEMSTMGRKFASTVMQPAFEQVISMRERLMLVATTIEKVAS